jgi:hypothetical protein
MLLRLHPNVHMGQETGKLGERVCIFGWIWSRRAYYHHSKAISPAIPRRYGTLLSSCTSSLFPWASVFWFFLEIPDRWMKQRDSPEFEEDSHLLELWPDWWKIARPTFYPHLLHTLCISWQPYHLYNTAWFSFGFGICSVWSQSQNTM